MIQIISVLKNAMAAADWLSASVRSAATERKLGAGERLFQAGSRSLGFYEVVSGIVRKDETSVLRATAFGIF